MATQLQKEKIAEEKLAASKKLQSSLDVGRESRDGHVSDVTSDPNIPKEAAAAKNVVSIHYMILIHCMIFMNIEKSFKNVLMEPGSCDKD